MNINYQKELEKHPIIGKWQGKGCTMPQIEALEKEIGKTFPQSYREFLFLAGEEPHITDKMMEYDSLLKMQVFLTKQLQRYGFTLSKPYWVISALDAEQFSLFFWGEGENPPIYTCLPSYVADGAPLLEKTSSTFTEYVNRGIEHFKTLAKYQ